VRYCLRHQQQPRRTCLRSAGGFHESSYRMRCDGVHTDTHGKVQCRAHTSCPIVFRRLSQSSANCVHLSILEKWEGDGGQSRFSRLSPCVLVEKMFLAHRRLVKVLPDAHTPTHDHAGARFDDARGLVHLNAVRRSTRLAIIVADVHRNRAKQRRHIHREHFCPGG